jgi:hypothetical protein
MSHTDAASAFRELAHSPAEKPRGEEMEGQALWKLLLRYQQSLP